MNLPETPLCRVCRLLRMRKKYTPSTIRAVATHVSALALLFTLIMPRSPSRAGDHQPDQSGQSAETNHDCGFVSFVSGSPVIRRTFMSQDEPGVVAFAADRINAGDSVEAAAGDRLELISGNNVIVVLGPGSKVKFSGLRAVPANGSAPATRLEMRLLAGAIRIQARLNEQRPETTLIRMAGAEASLARGDAEISSEGGWRVSVLAGSAELRPIPAGAEAASPVVREGMGVGSKGEYRLDADGIAEIRRRLPFSFETARAALPPRPASGALLEAP